MHFSRLSGRDGTISSHGSAPDTVCAQGVGVRGPKALRLGMGGVGGWSGCRGTQKYMLQHSTSS
jgi:hypothetical protein